MTDIKMNITSLASEMKYKPVYQLI